MTEIKEPRTMLWNSMKLVRMSDVPGLKEWMWGQTMPLVLNDELAAEDDRYDWVYVWDYERFIKGLPVID